MKHNIIRTGLVRTCSLPSFARDIVEFQLEKGMEHGRYGWDDPEQCSQKELLRLQAAAIKREDYKAAACYCAMLAALDHNSEQEPANAS